MRRLMVTAAALLATMLLAAPASAQYFGRNKVQYEDFEFSVLKTEHFDIYYYDREREAVEQAARLAERWYTRLSTLLQHQLRGRQPLILYASHPDFEQTTVIPGFINEATGGVTELLERRMVLPFTATLAETSHVLGHELVHAFQFDLGSQRTLALPLWLIEGMAEYLSLGPIHGHTAAWLRDAAIHENLPTFDDLANPEFFPYRFGHAAWAYLAGRWGDGVVAEIFAAASLGGDPVAAIEGVTGVEVEQLSKDWHAAIVRTYAEVDLSGVRARGQPVVSDERDSGELNIGPALSPDGSRLVFLSERSVFAIEMFLADAKTGEVIRKLTETATSPHLDSIQFLHSTGAWSPDGTRFAIPAVRKGVALLRVVDVSNGETVRDYTFDTLGEIMHPAWSPDGQRIAFSAMQGGTSDLYVCDVQSGTLDRLTQDFYADLHPAWSPDSRTLVFATDRFTTDLATLDFGDYRLGRYDVASERITSLPHLDGAKHINPQFSPDGSAVYFLSDPNGISNIYALTLDGGRIVPLTSVTTGVSGIAELSPALSVARDRGALAYSVFADGKYAIYRLDEAPEPVQALKVHAAVLPPARSTSLVADALGRATAGLPPPSATFSTAPYDPDLSLTYAGAAAGGSAGTDEFGSFVGGGISLMFSDVLRQHLFGVTADVNGGVRDIGGQVSYLNQTSRWNWGVAAQRFPMRSGLVAQAVGEVDGREAVIERVEIFRQINHQAEMLVQYPFDRSTRVEFSGGARRITFDRDVDIRAFSLSTGQLLLEESRELPSADGLTLGQATAALVYDTSVFGPTSPILGTRARLEVTPIFGTLSFSEVVADYRRYFVPVRPFTLAARVLHFGRYGSDGDSQQLNPLFLGFPMLVRGYDVGSFDASECVPNATGDCPAFDQLVGSRVLVGGLELRFPLIGAFKREFDYGPLPVEGLIFADTGVAWTDLTEPTFLGGDRDFVSSVGAGVRINVMGYLIAELDAVRALDRPDDRWRFIFNIRPGF